MIPASIIAENNLFKALSYMFLVYLKKHPDKECLYVKTAEFEKSCLKENKI